MDLEYLPRESLESEGSGRSFSELFRSKSAKKTAVGKKSAQMTTKININSLRDALGGAWGAKKNLGQSQKASGIIFEPIYQKWAPGRECQTCASIRTESAGSCSASFCFCSRRVLQRSSTFAGHRLQKPGRRVCSGFAVELRVLCLRIAFLFALWLPGCCVARCRKKRNRGSKHVEQM